jgi:hypothetical protein
MLQKLLAHEHIRQRSGCPRLHGNRLPSCFLKGQSITFCLPARPIGPVDAVDQGRRASPTGSARVLSPDRDFSTPDTFRDTEVVLRSRNRAKSGLPGPNSSDRPVGRGASFVAQHA